MLETVLVYCNWNLWFVFIISMFCLWDHEYRIKQQKQYWVYKGSFSQSGLLHHHKFANQYNSQARKPCSKQLVFHQISTCTRCLALFLVTCLWLYLSIYCIWRYFVLKIVNDTLNFTEFLTETFPKLISETRLQNPSKFHICYNFWIGSITRTDF